MDLRQLQQFAAVAEELHFTRAARRLNIVQSALSTSIRALETELGAQLFRRTTRGVQITPEGEALYDKARLILIAVREARDVVAATQRLERGRLTVGVVQSLSAFLDLPALLQAFHQRHPNIEVRLRQAERSHLVEQVADGRIDLAVLPAVEMPDGLGADIVVDEPMALVCPAGHPLASRTGLTAADLAGETFVEFQPGWGTRGPSDQFFAEASLKRRIQFEVNTLTTLLALVERGMGVALAPEFNARKHGPSVAVAPLAPPAMRLKMMAVYVAAEDGQPQLSVARAFKAVLDLGTQGPAGL